MRIENSVPEDSPSAGRGLPSDISSEGILKLHRAASLDFLSCTPFLRQFHLSSNMLLLYESYAKISKLEVVKCSILLLSKTLTPKCFALNDIKLMPKCHKDILKSCKRSTYTKGDIPLTLSVMLKFPSVCKK